MLLKEGINPIPVLLTQYQNIVHNYPILVKTPTYSSYHHVTPPQYSAHPLTSFSNITRSPHHPCRENGSYLTVFNVKIRDNSNTRSGKDNTILSTL